MCEWVLMIQCDYNWFSNSCKLQNSVTVPPQYAILRFQDVWICVCSYRCGPSDETPGIPPFGTGRHTGHKLWPSHQLHKNKSVETYYTFTNTFGIFFTNGEKKMNLKVKVVLQLISLKKSIETVQFKLQKATITLCKVNIFQHILKTTFKTYSEKSVLICKPLDRVATTKSG